MHEVCARRGGGGGDAAALSLVVGCELETLVNGQQTDDVSQRLTPLQLAAKLGVKCTQARCGRSYPGSASARSLAPAPDTFSQKKIGKDEMDDESSDDDDDDGANGDEGDGGRLDTSKIIAAMSKKLDRMRAADAEKVHPLKKPEARGSS